MVNFGIAAEIRWRVWGTGTQADFNGFRVLALCTLVVGVSQTLQR